MVKISVYPRGNVLYCKSCSNLPRPTFDGGTIRKDSAGKPHVHSTVGSSLEKMFCNTPAASLRPVVKDVTNGLIGLQFAGDPSHYRSQTTS